MNDVIVQHAPRAHGSEVAWALWCCVVLNLHLTAEAARAVSEMDDPIVALVALHARAVGLVPSGLGTSEWEQHLTAASLLGPNWLLTYESIIKGWLTPPGPNPILSSQEFAFLQQAGVSFYAGTSAVARDPLGLRRNPKKRLGGY